jgi:hypothetical protein
VVLSNVPNRPPLQIVYPVRCVLQLDSPCEMHGRDDVDPTTDAVPSSGAWHVLEPSLPWNMLKGHAVHTVALPVEKVFTGHMVHETPSAAPENQPGGHGTAPFNSPVQNEPGGHAKHDDWPASGWK